MQEWQQWRVRAAALKKAKGLTDKKIADAIREKLRGTPHTVGRGAVNTWFCGTREPNVPQFAALCTILGASPDDLLFPEHQKKAGGEGKHSQAKLGHRIEPLTPQEYDLLQAFRRLPPEEQRQVIEFAEDRLARALLRGGGRVLPLLRARKRTQR